MRITSRPTKPLVARKSRGGRYLGGRITFPYYAGDGEFANCSGGQYRRSSGTGVQQRSRDTYTVETAVIAVIILFCLERDFTSFHEKTTVILTRPDAGARCGTACWRPSPVQPPFPANARASIQARSGLQAAFWHTRRCHFSRLIWHGRDGICCRQPDVARRRNHYH